MSDIVAFCNQKGGVGKTTTAVNVSAIAADKGIKTLLIDLDPQGNATSGVGVDKNSLELSVYHLLMGQNSIKECIVSTSFKNLYVLPSKAELTGAELELIDIENREYRLKNSLKDIEGEYDLIILDCPPSLNLLTINGLCSSSKLVIPLQCEYYALEGLGQLVQTFELIRSKLNPDIEIAGVVLTMVDRRTKLAEQVISEVTSFFGDKVFKSAIPRAVRISEAPSFGTPLIEYDPSGKGTKAFISLTEEFLTRLGLQESKKEAGSSEPKKTTPIIESTETTTQTEEAQSSETSVESPSQP